MTILAPKLPIDFEWQMAQAVIRSEGVWVRSVWDIADDMNKLFVLRGSTDAMVSVNKFHNPQNGIDWHRVEFRNGSVGYVASDWVTVDFERRADGLPDGVDDAMLYAIVDAWMAKNVHLSDAVVTDSVHGWLDAHGQRLIHEWLSANMDEILLKVTGDIFD